MNKFITFHALILCKYFDENLDKYPKKKKNKKEATDAPIPGVGSLKPTCVLNLFFKSIIVFILLSFTGAG